MQTSQEGALVGEPSEFLLHANQVGSPNPKSPWALSGGTPGNLLQGLLS